MPLRPGWKRQPAAREEWPMRGLQRTAGNARPNDDPTGFKTRASSAREWVTEKKRGKRKTVEGQKGSRKRVLSPFFIWRFRLAIKNQVTSMIFSKNLLGCVHFLLYQFNHVSFNLISLTVFPCILGCLRTSRFLDRNDLFPAPKPFQWRRQHQRFRWIPIRRPGCFFLRPIWKQMEINGSAFSIPGELKCRQKK